MAAAQFRLNMARLRRDTIPPVVAPPLRIFATGAVFLTHALVLPTHPLPATVSRAQSVYTSRGGAAAHVLALLAQLAATVPAAGDIQPMLIASLGGSPDALRLRDALEAVGVRTKYCKVWPGLGVPSAWVVHARDTDARTVINHNPLPEVSHEDFIALLGPVLAPENYVGFNPTPPLPNSPPVARDQQSSSPGTLPTLPAPRPSLSSRPLPSTNSAPPPSPHSYTIPSPSLHSPAPFDWLHFEGRSVRTTLANLVGVDGLARERRWRSHCVISVDLGRRARDGVEALIPHADVVFLSVATFPSLSAPGQPAHPAAPPPGAAANPRAILLSLARHAPSHALLVLNAGRDGAALLSLPTSEYLQSSGWTQLPSAQSDASCPGGHAHTVSNTTNGTRTTHPSDGVESVRSGSDFWAAGGPADVSFTSQESAYTQRADGRSHRHFPSGESFHPMDDDDDEEGPEHGEDAGGEDGRQTPQPDRGRDTDEQLDEEGAHAAFVAGMIWALSRRVLPGPPYVPGLETDGDGNGKETAVDVGIRWRLDECLRFATELACRKAHVRADDFGSASMASSSGHARERSEWDGLGEAMRRAGWFD